jgi:hypothetical protein
VRLDQRFLLRAQLLLGNTQLLEREHQRLVALVRGLAPTSIVIRGIRLTRELDGIGKPLDV